MDPYTLHLTDSLVNATCGATMIIAWFQSRFRACFALWASALVIFGASLLLAGITNLHPAVAAGQYAGLVAGVMLVLAGFRSFDGRKALTPWMAWCIPAPTAVYFTVAELAMDPDLAELAAFLVSCLVSLPLSVYVLTAPAEVSIYRRIAGIAMVLQLTFTLGIVATAAAFPEIDGIAIAIPLADQVFTIVVFTGILGMSVARNYDAIKELAHRDALTGALNRTGLALRTKGPLRKAGVLVADLDHFKSINDRYGHPAGDAVLCEFVRRTTGCLPQKAHLCRSGGEEFVVVIPDADVSEAMAVAQNIRLAAKRRPIDWSDRAIDITVSVGIAALRDGEDLNLSIARADEALYRAKIEGRDRVAA